MNRSRALSLGAMILLVLAFSFLTAFLLVSPWSWVVFLDLLLAFSALLGVHLWVKWWESRFGLVTAYALVGGILGLTLGLLSILILLMTDSWSASEAGSWFLVGPMLALLSAFLAVPVSLFKWLRRRVSGNTERAPGSASPVKGDPPSPARPAKVKRVKVSRPVKSRPSPNTSRDKLKRRKK